MMSSQVGVIDALGEGAGSDRAVQAFSRLLTCDHPVSFPFRVATPASVFPARLHGIQGTLGAPVWSTVWGS